MDKESYIAQVTEQIRCRRAREDVAEELRDHIEDQERAYLAAGMDKEEAAREAVRQMGDPVEAGMALDRIHRPKLELGLLLPACLLIVAGLALQCGINGDSKIVRQGVWTAAGLGIMTAMYFLDYRIIGRYAYLLYGGLALFVLAGIGAFGNAPLLARVNGRYDSALPVLMLLVPVFAGVLYRLMGTSVRGLLLAEGLAGAGLMLAYLIGSRTMMAVLGISFAAMLLLAVSRGWFALRPRIGYGCIGGSIAAAAGVVLYLAYSSGGKMAYGIRRLLSALGVDSGTQVDYQADVVREVVKGVHFAGRGDFPAEEFVGRIADVSSDVIFTYVLNTFGVLAGIVVAVLLGMVIWKMFSLLWDGSHRLGGMLAFGCAVFLGADSLCYLLYNLGIGLFSPVYLPFFSRTGSGMAVSCLMLGLVLSVYRNRRVFREEKRKTLAES